ncbi:hypothetical protein SLA2020_174010 [Shorea laevis]
MSIKALKDLNSLPASESKNDDSMRGCLTKPCNGNMNENVEEKQRKKSSPIHVNGGETVNSGVELLLKSSQYKKFVCEAAERALEAMTTWVSPIVLSPKLQPYLKNGNPRIRAKASMCFSRSVPQLGVEGIKTYGIDRLMQGVIRVTDTNVAREGRVVSS